MTGFKVQPQVGEGCYIVPTYLGTEPYLVRIGNHVAIAAGVKFITHDGGAWLFRNAVPDLQVFGPIIIEDNVVLGENVILLPGVTVGSNTVIGAGSVVMTDIPPNSIALGNPARPFGSVEKYRQKCVERWSVQKPPRATVGTSETWWQTRHFAANRQLLHEHLLELYSEKLKRSEGATSNES